MSENKKNKSYALEVSLIIMAVIAAFFVQRFVQSTNPPELPDMDGEKSALESGIAKAKQVALTKEEALDKVPEIYVAHLSDLEAEPDWKALDVYQFTISKEDFTRLLEEVYTIRTDWKKWVVISEEYATIRTHAEDDFLTYQLHFANEEREEEAPKFWRGKNSIKHSDKDLPLEGVRIVIDPGHIGGNYASVEERKFKFGETAPIQEGNLSLTVAKLLERQLEVLGAEVDLTRDENTPVNPKRAGDYAKYAQSKMEVNGGLISEDAVSRVSEKLFYRAGEIRERAKVINNEYKPDIVLCIHFNAVAWDENKLEEKEHAHLILHGAYTSGELAKDDQRFQLMEKLLQRNHAEEKAVSASVARAMTVHTGLPPYMYEPLSTRAVNVDDNPYLWARNLAANRAYRCPVVFCEPYLMNGADSHARLQVGDYDGLRYVNGMLRPSIFHEYVNFVSEGLVNYYRDRELSE